MTASGTFACLALAATGGSAARRKSWSVKTRYGARAGGEDTTSVVARKDGWMWMESDAAGRGWQFPTTEIAQAVRCPVPSTETWSTRCQTSRTSQARWAAGWLARGRGGIAIAREGQPCIRRDSVTERLERPGFHSSIDHAVEIRGASFDQKRLAVR